MNRTKLRDYFLLVSFSQADASRLKKLAGDLGITRREVVRRAIRRYARHVERQTNPLAGLPDTNTRVRNELITRIGDRVMRDLLRRKTKP